MKKPASVWIAFLGLASLGITDGMLGVAWPSMRGDFNVSLDALGTLLLPAVAAYTLASAYSGALVRRFSLGQLLILGAALRTIGVASQSLAPYWGFMIAAVMVNGMGSASIDAGLNNYMAANQTARNMNWMHGFYGVGITLGPLLVTRVLLVGQSWRWSYAVAASIQLLLLVLFIATRDRWGGVEIADPAQKEEQQASMRATLGRPVVWLGILMFFLYTGTEVGAGQWAFTLFTEGRGADVALAGYWVSGYWGSFTAGRFLLGAISDRLNLNGLLRACMVGSLIGLGLLWWNPVPLAGFLGLAFAGLSMAVVFPVLMSNTPVRVGRAHAANAIGLQVAFAGVGVGLLVGGVGWLAENAGLESIPPFLFAMALLMLLCYEGAQLLSQRKGYSAR